MELHLNDQNCRFCNPQQGDYLREFRLHYKSLTFVVHFCCHYYGKQWMDAALMVGELYDDIETCLHWRDTDLDPAMHYGLRHKGYWKHECDAYYMCGDCGCRHAYKQFRLLGNASLSVGGGRVIHIFSRDSDAVSDFLGKRFCDECFRTRVNALLERNEREMSLWLEQAMLEKRELSQLRKLQGLFSEAKKALRQNKGREALQLLKEGFEQAASLPE